MKGFALDEKGDVLFEKNDIKMENSTALLAQKIRQVLSTNRGEWWLNEKEGVPVQKILKKNPNAAQIKDYVRSAIAQVDGTLQMTKCDITVVGRRMKITFAVSGAGGEAETELEV